MSAIAGAMQLDAWTHLSEEVVIMLLLQLLRRMRPFGRSHYRDARHAIRSLEDGSDRRGELTHRRWWL